jgi:hypothetical protein
MASRPASRYKKSEMHKKVIFGMFHLEELEAAEALAHKRDGDDAP